MATRGRESEITAICTQVSGEGEACCEADAREGDAPPEGGGSMLNDR